MSTIVTHQWRQSRSVKIWVDDSALRSPPRVLAGFNSALVFVGAPLASDWRLDLTGNDMGGGLFHASVMMPNGLSVKFTHESIASIVFTTYPLAVLWWQVVVIRLPWATTSPLVPTFHVIDGAAVDPETDTILGVLKRKSSGAGPTFYSAAPAENHSWPYHLLHSSRGVEHRVDYDLSGVVFDKAGLVTSATRSRGLPLGASRWRFDDEAYDHFRFQLLGRTLSVAPGPGDAVYLSVTISFLRLGQPQVQDTIYSGVVDVSGTLVTTLAALLDLTPSLSTLLPSSDDWAAYANSDILEVQVDRIPGHPSDTYAGSLDLSNVFIDLATLKPGRPL
jgi:hypothetical protein